MQRTQRIGRVLTVWAVLLACGMGGTAQAEVESRLANYLATADLRGTEVSVCVVDVSRGEVLAELDADRSMIPASNMKLITTAAALGTLGEDFRFSTRLAMLPPGARPGDDEAPGGLPALVIVGDGDPAFGDPATLDAAAESVAVADALAVADPRLLEGVNDAFLLGLHTGCLVIGTMCLLGAVFSLVALPGRRFALQIQARDQETTDSDGEKLTAANLPG